MSSAGDRDRITGARPSSAIAALRQFARPRAAQPCDLCGSPLDPQHRHLLNPAQRRILCACPACVILLSGGPGSRFRQIPARAELWPEFSLSDAQWQALQIPIDLAFFLRSTPLDKIVALYPAPGGAIQSSPPPQAWEELAAKNPRLKELEADTEALLVNRIRGASEVYRAPIDECYRLAGLIRLSWRGWSGGAEMWDQVNQFFRELKEKSERGREGRDA